MYFIGSSEERSDIRINVPDLINDIHCIITTTSGTPDSEPKVYLTDASQYGTYLNMSLVGEGKSTIRPGYLTVKTTKREIASGSQSSVYLAYDKRRPSRQLACKVTNIRKEPFFGASRLGLYKRELEILKGNKHPNIISLVAAHKTQEHGFVFLPLYYGGDLQECQYSCNTMDEDLAMHFMQQLFAGLKYIHGKQIIHCDLKPGNVLLSERLEDKPRLIITDFGHAMNEADKPTTWPEDWGTPAYRAPEMVKLQEFSCKVDCWAAGIIFYQLLEGVHPFAVFEGKESLDSAILPAEIQFSSAVLESVSQKSRDLVSQLTAKDHCQRPQMRDVVSSDSLAEDASFLREQEWWFGEKKPSPPTQRLALEEGGVAWLKECRDPSHHDTVLTIKE
ncbi:kinase-like domain-containing protein [Mucor lusitanicus]|nr:kinase-like domain-containing protein [Mucor lusitanicus]